MICFIEFECQQMLMLKTCTKLYIPIMNEFVLSLSLKSGASSFAFWLCFLHSCLWCWCSIRHQNPSPSSTQPKAPPKEEEEDECGEDGETLCSARAENYASDEFWICCNVCEKGFHRKCAKIAHTHAGRIKQ